MSKLRNIIATVLAAGLLPMSAGAGDQALERPASHGDLDVTMRIIEDPEALRPDAVTRRIELPPALAREPVLPAQPGGEDSGNGPGPDQPGGPPVAAEFGLETSREAQELGREFGQQAAERARELAEQARELREEFGRTRAERPRPEPPRRDPPVPPTD